MRHFDVRPVIVLCEGEVTISCAFALENLLDLFVVISLDVGSDEEGSVEENGSDEGEEFEVKKEPCADELLDES